MAGPIKVRPSDITSYAIKLIRGADNGVETKIGTIAGNGFGGFCLISLAGMEDEFTIPLGDDKVDYLLPRVIVDGEYGRAGFYDGDILDHKAGFLNIYREQLNQQQNSLLSISASPHDVELWNATARHQISLWLANFRDSRFGLPRLEELEKLMHQVIDWMRAEVPALRDTEAIDIIAHLLFAKRTMVLRWETALPVSKAA